MDKPKSALLIGAALAAGVLLLLITHTKGKLVYPDLLIFLLPALPSVAVAWCALRLFPSRRMAAALPGKDLPILVLFFFVLLYLCSSAPRDRWFFFLSWRPIGETALESGLLQFALITLLLTPLVIFGVRRPRFTFTALLILSQAACFAAFVKATGGGILYRNDHPSFLFRIHEFSRNFPQAINYLPYWNAGRVHYYSTTSGTPSIGLFYLPLWRSLPVHAAYTLVIGFSFIVLGPLLAVSALLASGGGLPAAAIGGLLFLSLGQEFFRHTFEFGTVGGVFALCFALPFAAGIFRVAWFPRRSLLLAATILFSGVFFLLWPPSVLVALAMIVPWLLKPSQWSRKKWAFFAACALALALLCGRWLLVCLLDAKDVTGYFQSAISEDLKSGSLVSRENALLWRQYLASSFRKTNPLVLFMGLAAAFVSPFTSIRRWYPFVFLPLLAAPWLNAGDPRLQLDRLLLALGAIAVLPAALSSWRLLRTRDARLAPVRAALLALLILAAVNQVRLFSNQGTGRFRVIDDPQSELITFLTEAEPMGRVLLAGASRQAYGDGQVAYLPVMTGKEMLALDYYYFPEEWTASPFPPRPFDRDPDKLFSYMELYNVTHVVAYESQWVRRLLADERRYREVKSIHFPYGPEGHDARIFKVLRRPSFLLEGEGTVRSRGNRIEVALSEPRDTVVLKYNWDDGLRPEGPVEIFPFDAGEGIRLVGVRPGGRVRFAIGYHSVL